MRIIAGRAKGIRLFSPKGLEIRPTLDRVRESLFNILSPRIEGSRFLDLFAGTGANGIEALSRGSSEAYFIDEDRQALDIVRQNLQATRLQEKAICVKGRLPEDLRMIQGAFDIIFADPPYAFAEYALLLETLLARQLVATDGILIVEHERRCILPENLGLLQRSRQQRYGDTILSFYT